MYEVTVRASVGGDTGERMVRVTVGNVDEAPVISEPGLAVYGSSSVYFSEGEKDAEAMFKARGPMQDMARWTLEGADAHVLQCGPGKGRNDGAYVQESAGLRDAQGPGHEQHQHQHLHGHPKGQRRLRTWTPTM